MILSGLASSGFIIAVSISLLLVGAAVYHFNCKMKALETNVSNQQIILSDFIASIKHKLQARNLATQRAEVAFEPASAVSDEWRQAADSGEQVELSTDEENSDDDEEDDSKSGGDSGGVDNSIMTSEVGVVNLSDVKDTFEQADVSTTTLDQLITQPSREEECSTIESEPPDTAVELGKLKVVELKERVREQLGWEEARIKKAKKQELLTALTEEAT